METTQLDAWRVMRRFYAAEAAYVTGDADFAEVARYLDPDVELYQAPGLPFSGNGVWRGYDGLRKFLNVFSQTWASMEMLKQRHVLDGNHLSVTSLVRFQARATGREVQTWIAQLITVRDGRMLRCRPFYWDPAAIAEACAA